MAPIDPLRTQPQSVAPRRQRYLVFPSDDGLCDRASKITAANAVLHGDVALLALAVNLFSTIRGRYLCELSERDTFSRGRQETHILNCLTGIAIRSLVAEHEIVTGLALQYLAHGSATNSSLDRILHIGYIDSETCGSLPVHGKCQVGLADYPEQPQIFDPADIAPDADNFVALRLKCLQIVAINLDGQLAFYATYCFFHVVGDGLGEVPDDSRDLFQFLIHGCNEILLILVEGRSPLVFGFQTDVVLCIEKSGCVGAVVRTANLTRALSYPWE